MRLLSVDASELAPALERVGVERGRILFVHSAFSQMKWIRVTPIQVIEILQDAVGKEGTLAMPAFAMTGSSKEWLEQHQSFDWRKTPSQVGMLTEVFRRMKGTERSMHPTHSVTARGPDAAWLTQGHERSLTPFDEASPFQKMADRNALVLRLGEMSVMTFRHFADHKLQAHVALPIYGEREIPITLVDREKKQSSMVTRAHNPRVYCDHSPVLERLAREGGMRRERVGRFRMSLVPVQTYIDVYSQELEAGRIKHVPKTAPTEMHG
ncbi:MAG TPA: AAC(3) family N-acetyltransferase [Gemmatimonadaceae bacterium]|nr:AAC(3) family N-acetyltransferase [Gemmatimonadaceae bacterium]